MSEQRTDVPGDICRRCGAPLTAGAKLCTKCGTYVKSGLNAKTVARAKGAGKLGLALTAGAVTAIICGVVWAAVAVALSLELGFLAWGIGGLTGLVMISCTQARGPNIATAAAGFAVLGILIGKLLIVAWVTPSAGEIAAEVARNDLIMSGLLLMHMAERGELDADLTAYLESDDGTPPSKEVGEKFERAQKDAVQRVSRMSREQKEEQALPAAKAGRAEISYTDNLKHAFSPFDLLWGFLAIGTALKIGSGGEG